MDNGTQRDRLITFIESKRMTRREFQDSIGVSISYVHNMSGSIRQPILSRIEETYPELNIDWLVNGKGEMINDRKKRVINQIKSDNEVAAMIGIESMIPLLPTSAMAGKLTDFSDGIDENNLPKDFADVATLIMVVNDDQKARKTNPNDSNIE